VTVHGLREAAEAFGEFGIGGHWMAGSEGRWFDRAG
jgi:hypothetical protein